MGNQVSTGEQAGEARFDVQFDAKEIKRLERRFKKMDVDNSGGLRADEIMSLPGMKQNPLVERVLRVFDRDGSGEVEFREFVQGVSGLTAGGGANHKLRFAFQIYDVDGDGFISNGELFAVLKSMVGGNVADEQLQQVVDKALLYADTDGDGKLSFSEFSRAIANVDVEEKLTIDFNSFQS